MALILRGLKNRGELDRILQFYPAVFTKTPLSYFSSRLLNDPYLKPDDIRIAEENGEILSTITVYRRKMYWRGKTVDFAGIGNVATRPDKRGLGLSSKVMRDSIDYIKKLNIPIVILFTGINQFYERYNFFTIPAFQVKFLIQSSDISQFNIRRFRQEDLEEIQRFYETFNRSLKGAIYREPVYWKANLSFAAADEIFLVAEKHKKITAYIRVSSRCDKGEILEFAFSDVPAFYALLCHTAELLNKQELTSAALLPKNLFDSTFPCEVHYEPSTIAMALILNDDDTVPSVEDFAEYTFHWTDDF